MERVSINNNSSIERIENRCINCGMCKKTCIFNNDIENNCINCGQCILTCPTGALVPKYCYKKVLNYINDTDYIVTVSIAPAVRTSIGEEFNIKDEENIEKKLVTILHQLGFDYVFDVSFGADLTIMEEAKEFIERLNKKEKLPLLTSCCPSWVKYVNDLSTDLKENLSTTKSPMGMQTILIKNYFAKYMDIPKNKIVNVLLAPCVSKKTELMSGEDNNFVITTTELAMMIRENNLIFETARESEFDLLLGSSTGAGVIFGVSGGVMEAMLRTVYYLLNNEIAPENFWNKQNFQEENDIKTFCINMKQKTINIAIVNKISTFKNNVDKIKNYDIVEVMCCPVGCISGGGQPLISISKQKEVYQKRANLLLNISKNRKIQNSFESKEIQDLYKSYLDYGNKHLLHNK